MGFPHGVSVRSILNLPTLEFNTALEKDTQESENQSDCQFERGDIPQKKN
jgi:hypothetical protein